MQSAEKPLDPVPSGCVVLVGPNSDCREVLETALANRGLKTYSSGQTGNALRLIREHEPDVVVLDGEAAGADDSQMQAELTAHVQRSQSALIVLGRIRGQGMSAGEVLAKPYHFAPLVHRIEKLAEKRAA